MFELQHENPTIHIAQCANGFTVTLPFIPTQVSYTDEIGKVAERIQKIQQQDPELARLRGESMEDAFQTPPPPKLKDVKHTRLYVFKTFPEVLDFLAAEMKK